MCRRMVFSTSGMEAGDVMSSVALCPMSAISLQASLSKMPSARLLIDDMYVSVCSMSKRFNS